MPNKNISLLGRRFDIEGVSKEDPYFQGLSEYTDRDFVSVITRMLSADATAVDIGANIGVTSLMLSTHLSAGQVFSFEPSPSVFPLLKRNITTNDLPNVTFQELAVGAAPGRIGFVGESAYGHLVAGSDHDEYGVEVKTLDRIVEEQGINKVDFIKIDVEGFESDVLDGAAEVEKAFSPLYYIEFNAFCIAAYRQMNPLEFARRVLTDFEHVYHVNHDGVLTKVDDDAASLLHRNIVDEGSVSNLLLTNDANRLNLTAPELPEIAQEPEQAPAPVEDPGPDPVEKELNVLAEQLRRAETERDHARRYPWKYFRTAFKQRMDAKRAR